MESTNLLEKVKVKSIILLVEKVSDVRDNRKEAVVTTSLLEKKSLTKDVDKGTGNWKVLKRQFSQSTGRI